MRRRYPIQLGLALLVIVATTTPASATAGDVVWARSMPTQWGCNAVTATLDGNGVIVLSEVITDTGLDVVVTRMDTTDGAVVWEYVFNGVGPNRHNDEAIDLALSPDGAVTAVLANANGHSYGALIGLDTATGSVRWSREIRGEFDDIDRATRVRDLDVRPEGAFVVTGVTPSRTDRSDVFVVSLDAATGVDQWYRRIDVRNDAGLLVRTTEASTLLGFLVKWRHRVHGWYASIDSTTGEIRWMVRRGRDVIYDMEVSPDSAGLYGLGTTLRALDPADGSVLWRLRPNRVPSTYPSGALEVGPDGSPYLTGTSGDDVRTNRLSPVDGSVIWSSVYNGPADLRDEGHDVVISGDGATVFVVGSRDVQFDPVVESDMLVLGYEVSTGSMTSLGAYLEPGTYVETGWTAARVGGDGLVACGRRAPIYGVGAVSVRFATS
jgi:hypothetical protein